MRIRCRFGEQNFTVTLLESPSAREFAAMLPLELDIEDYSANEKIAYLPRKLTEEGAELSRTRLQAISATSRRGAISPSFIAATSIRTV